MTSIPCRRGRVCVGLVRRRTGRRWVVGSVAMGVIAIWTAARRAMGMIVIVTTVVVRLVIGMIGMR